MRAALCLELLKNSEKEADKKYAKRNTTNI